MASAFQRRKVLGVFDAMDAEGRGFLEEGDFAALATRWTSLRGLDPVSAGNARLREIMLGWWASLSAAALDPDRVRLEDVLAVVDLLPGMAEAVAATADAMFEAIDENGDGLISRPEYRQLIEVWNGRATDTDEVFSLLDSDGDDFIPREEFRLLWYEFWAGDDPQAAGSLVFGRLQAM